jgi:immune inhibitor A
MSQGSYGTQTDDLGSAPIHFSAWDKFQLGFLNNYNVVRAGQRATIQMGPAEYNTKKAQATFVILPDKEVTRNVGSPFEGSSFYYSGAANDLDTTMVRSVDLPTDAQLSAQVRYSIEHDFDYAYVTVDGNLVPTSLSNSSVNADGIDGHSAGWVNLTVDLSGFTGPHDIGFGYLTDGGVQGDGDGSTPGFAIDNIAITGEAVDGAESDAGWTFASNSDAQGFHVTTGSETFQYTNYYVLENRQYIGYDKGLKTGPYNFGFLQDPDLQNYVEHFPYQDGLLIWYWDNSFDDNNVGDHPGGGLILPVDSHPAINHWSSGAQMRPRINSYDSTFTTTPTDSITLHTGGVAATIPSMKAVSVFDDSKSYWVASDPSDGSQHYQASWNSVKVPNTGTVIQVKSISSTGTMVVDINK